MDINVASNFLVGSILFGLGFCILTVAIVIINNIIAEYWKPVKIFSSDSWSLNPPVRYAQEEPTHVAPTFKETK